MEKTMNLPVLHSGVNWLFLDLNAFFASCEQQDDPALRGRPIIVAQMLSDSTVAIAASYEAKAFGIKTGTRVGEAKRLCPALTVVQAKHQRYAEYHERVLNAVETCIPVEKVMSIDEVACKLTGKERQIPVARELAQKIKLTLREMVGECLSCSIGLAPSVFLSKVASDIQKPDGLVVITLENLPDALLPLKLQDIYGIGSRMESRLKGAGITTVSELWQASSSELRRVWGGVNGVLFHQMLHGVDLQPPCSSFARSLGHQHVLEPNLRNAEGARQFARHLLNKAGERLRHKRYYCRRLAVHLRWSGDLGDWSNETTFHETQDTGFLLRQLKRLFETVPLYKPLSVGITLLDLVPATQHQPDLFEGSERQDRLSPLLDGINRRFGRNTIGFGKAHEDISRFTGHAAFQRVPESWEF
jgi:DNA polymerase-4